MSQGLLEHTKFNYHAKFSNKDGMEVWDTLTPNGSVVWLGAVCVGVGEFFASPGKQTQVVPSR